MAKVSARLGQIHLQNDLNVLGSEEESYSLSGLGCDLKAEPQNSI